MIRTLFQNQKEKVESELLSFIQNKQFFSNLLFFLTLLFLPTQFGLHTWPFFAFVSGLRIDYLSPAFYLTDISIFLLFVFSWKRFFAHILIPFFFLVLFLVIGIFLSVNPLVGWWGLVKFCEFIFFGWFVVKQEDSSRYLRICFFCGILFESVLALLQFFRQSSLGGVFYCFGERSFTGTTPGVANASINGQLLVRPYGTFSHPNVLAGYLLITTLFLFIRFLQSKHILYLFTIILGTIALFVTLSRTAILLWIISLPLIMLWEHKKKIMSILFSSLCFLFFILLIIFSSVLYGRFFSIFSDSEDISLRLQLGKAAFSMIAQHPLFGVGLNNFLPNLPYYVHQVSFAQLQPVHNIFLFIAAETGIIGGILFCLLFIFAFRSIVVNYILDKSFYLWVGISLSTIILIGQIDHYFVTLQQGQLLFALIIGASFANKKNMIQ